MDLINSLIDTTFPTYLQDSAVDCLLYTDVVFKINFGPWIAGDYCHCLMFNFLKGLIIEYDIKQNVVQTCNFCLQHVAN